jgi:hypothetical protein
LIIAAAWTPQGSNAKVSYFFERATSLAQGEQRNKWQGPAAGGKDAVYAGCELEPTQWSAPGAGGSAWLFLGSVGFLFCLLAAAAVQSSGFHNVCCPNVSFFDARFKLLSVGAGS